MSASGINPVANNGIHQKRFEFQRLKQALTSAGDLIYTGYSVYGKTACLVMG